MFLKIYQFKNPPLHNMNNYNFTTITVVSWDILPYSLYPIMSYITMVTMWVTGYTDNDVNY